MYIVDIDGTIADLSHRLHYVQGKHKNYDKFFDEMHLDKPIFKVIETIERLRDAGSKVVFVSGRPESHREVTETFIVKYFQITSLGQLDVRMRKTGDYRKDSIVKSELLDEVLKDYGITESQILGVFDDRPSVIEMWKARGLTVFKVGDWESEESVFKRLRKPTLHMLIGPTGAGKTTLAYDLIGFCNFTAQYVSTDSLRSSLLGDESRQDQNDAIFVVAHKLIQTYLDCGFDVVYDATNLRDADRKKILSLVAEDVEVVYHVLNRKLEDKMKTDRWNKPELVKRHEEIFKSNLKNILKGDFDERVKVVDHRS